jgi:class 3 adenylate cyclase
MRLEPSSERRKLATLVFCDIVGSTQLAEQLEPEVHRSVVTRWYIEMRAALEGHGGTVEKFAGDAVMAVFGVPQAREDDALRAIRAACEMQERHAALGAQLRRLLGRDLAIRIGVNSGEVMSSETGDGLVTGDAVNVASRLETLAEPGQILLGPITVRLAGRAIESEPVGTVELRGKRDPVEAHRLLRVLEAHELPAAEPAAALVGRDEQLAALEQHVREVAGSGAASVALVTGPAGIGKTRIAQELLGRMGGTADGLHVRCEPGDGTAALAGLARALAGSAEASADAGELAARLAVGEPAPPAEARWAVQRLLEAAASRPYVAVLDDLQRAGPVLLDLVDDAARLQRPLALVCLARDDEAPRLPEAALRLSLDPLAPAAAEELLDQLLGETAVDPPLRRRLRDAAGGNPLFAEELAAMVASTEVGGTVPLPPTLGALLGSRLDRLAPEDRLAIDVAAVEGETFAPATVEALAGPDAAARIGPLEAAGLLHAVEDGRLRFHHVLLRDAAYGALSKARRAELHERLARTIDGTASAVSARHLDRAATYRRELGLDLDVADELAAEAAQHFAAAGLRALEGGDVPAAVELLGRADELGAGTDIALALGDALADAGEMARADEVLARVERVASGPTAVLARLGRLERGPYRELASDWAAREVDSAEAALVANPAGLARSAVVRARIAHAHCRFAAKAVALERALDHARAAGDARLQRAARVELAAAVVTGPTPVPHALAQVRELEAEAGNGRATLASLRAARGLLEAMDGRLDEGRRLAEEARDVLAELGLAAAEAEATALLIRIELLAGRSEAAARLAVPAVQRVQALGDAQRVGVLAALAGDALLAVGRADLAERQARTARGAASRDDVATRIHWRSLEARLLARRQRADEAAGLAREAVALARETDWLELRADASMALFDVLGSAGADARAALAEALECYREKGNRVAAERASF